MKRVLVTLVSIGLIAGLAALVPLLAGDPASAATPCTAQHRAVVRAQQRVDHDRAKITKDRRHHRAAAVRKDRKRLAADQRKLKTARLRYQLCRANHKPGKTTTITASASPSTSSSAGTPSGLPSGFPTTLPTGFPTDLPTELASYFPSGVPTDIASQLATAFPSGVPTDPTVVCSILAGIGVSVCSIL